MNTIRSPFSSVMVLACVLMSVPASGQATRPAARDLVERLLDESGPVRSWEPVNFGIPPDDAPIEQVLAYWTSDDIYSPSDIAPSEKVRRRLLAACIDHPDKLPALLRLLPDDLAAANAVKVIYETHENRKIWEDDQRQSIRRWVSRRSRHFRDELIAAAQSVRYDNTSRLEYEDDLLALAKLDWTTAEPMLRKLADANDIHVAAVALQMLAESALATDNKRAMPELLGRLRKIADNRQAPAFARDRAFLVLESTPWEGRDAWYLSLFAEEELQNPLEEPNRFFSPLERPLRGDPDHFLPLVVRLLESTDATTRQAAASQLVLILRPAALGPLLPALSDSRNWPRGIRGHLLAALCDVNMPQAAPQILKAWPTLGDNERVDAALALAHCRAKEAPAALKSAMAAASNAGWDKRELLAREMVACDAMSDEAIAGVIEAYCAEKVEAATREATGDGADRPPTSNANLACALIQVIDQQKFALKLLKRADALEKSKPELAAQIRRELSEWPVAAVDNDLLARIARSDLDETMILAAVGRLPGIRMHAAGALRNLVQRGGRKAGFAAALLADDTITQSISHGNDRAAQTMLVAVARLAATNLPLADVARWLDDNDALISRAAERYLIGQDSPDSRRIVQARHPGVVVIFGGPWVVPPAPGQKTSYPTSKKEKFIEQLRGEIQRKDGPDAIYVMSFDGFTVRSGQHVIRVHGKRAVLTIDNNDGRLLTRNLTADEFKSLLDLLAADNFAELPSLLKSRVIDGIWYDYLHLTRQGGRHIYMNNPGLGGTAGSPYDRLTRLWWLLCNTGTFATHDDVLDRKAPIK